MDIVSYIESMAESSPWLVYVFIMIGPFIQEDSAVIVTATLSALGKINPAFALISIFIGLFLSDIWKYWIGWYALKYKSGKKFARKKKVMSLGDKVQAFPFTTLMSARFIPLTRIPTLIACGFFRLSYFKFCVFVGITALIFIALIFGSFHLLGTLLTEKIKWILPAIGIFMITTTIAVHLLGSRTNETDCM